jgi:chorismate mutase
MKVADEIGQVKKGSNVAVLQNRWNEILGKMILDGEQKDFLRSLYLECSRQFTKKVSFTKKVING